MTRRKNLIVATLGRKDTGKSQLLWDLYTSQAARVLSLDSMGESIERDPDAVEVIGMGQLIDTLQRCASYPRWHIAAVIDPDDVSELFALMTPRIGSNKPSLSVAFGGMAIECGEAYEIAPNGATRPEVLAGWRKGRHYMLSLFMAAQRPSSVAREVTALADHLYMFAQGEKRDIDYIADCVSRPVADRVRRLKKWECVFFNRDDGLAKVLNPARQVVETMNTMGEPEQLTAL